jgi:UDP-glucuronate 4-epimerase
VLVLVTCAAGFIDNELALRLAARGDQVIGIDNLNDYYDVNLKTDRLERLKEFDNFQFLKIDIADRDAVPRLFKEYNFDVVVNLAAQAGVRYSLENPHAYVDANLVGFVNILEGCRHSNVKHLVFASSSSVYGANTKLPFSESDNVDHPVSLYAATKKSNELMAHSYAHLYGLPCTGLRFFTVYGPWGRPDMAYFSFTRKILAGEPIPVFNEGQMQRDFTFIDDIVTGIEGVLGKVPCGNEAWQSDNPDPATSQARYRIFNIGNNQSVELLQFIKVLETLLGKKAKLNLLPMQDGDVPATYANTDGLEKSVGFKPDTTIEEGLERFVDWYRGYYSSQFSAND